MTAWALGVESPDIPGRVEIGLEGRFCSPDDRLDPHDRGLADGTAANELARLGERRIVAAVLGHSKHDRRVRGLFHHRPRVRDRVGDRFLYRDVLSSSRGRNHMLRVQWRRAQDLDRIDLVVGEQLIDGGIQPTDVPLAPPALEHVGARIAQRDDIALFMREIARDIQRRDVPDAHDPDPHSIHPASLAHRAAALLCRVAD